MDSVPDGVDVVESVGVATTESEGATVDDSTLGCVVGSTLPTT